VTAGLEAAEAEWERGEPAVRRIRRGLDARTALAVDRAGTALAAELARRLGPSFSRADLYAQYLESDGWGREVVRRALEPLSLPSAVTPLVDAAFAHVASFARDRG
jgi:hypothetical protein